MVRLSSLSIARPYILASAIPNDPSPSLPRKTNNSIPPKIQQQKLLRKQRQPSIAEIELAIGAGIFRENGIRRESEQDNSLFDSMLTNSVGKNEGSVEKKLRENGEWVIEQTERTQRSYGKHILVAVFLWILPIWIFAFLVASGILELPFRIPFLEDIIS